MVYLNNTFSLSMLPDMRIYSVRIIEMDIERFKQEAINAVSIWGHKNSVSKITEVLGRPVTLNRQSVSLQDGDTVLVAQYGGPRLAEGSTELPEDQWRWMKVTVMNRANKAINLSDYVSGNSDIWTGHGVYESLTVTTPMSGGKYPTSPPDKI